MPKCKSTKIRHSDGINEMPSSIELRLEFLSLVLYGFDSILQW